MLQAEHASQVATFEELLQRYGERIEQIATACVMRNGGCYDEAQDVYQDMMLRLYEQYRGHNLHIPKILGWVARVSANLWIDRARGIKRHKNVSYDNTIFDEMGNQYQFDNNRDISVDVEGYVVYKLGIEQPVRRVCEDVLKHGVIACYREAYELRTKHKMSYREVAAAQGISIGTVKSRIYRVRAAILQGLVRAGIVDKDGNFINT